MIYRGNSDIVWAIGGGKHFYFAIERHTFTHAYRQSYSHYELNGWFWPGFYWSFGTPRRSLR